MLADAWHQELDSLLLCEPCGNNHTHALTDHGPMFDRTIRIGMGRMV